MCTGTSFALYAMAAAAAVGAYASVENGNQQKKMYKAQAQEAVNKAAYDADAAKAHAEKIRRLGAAQRGETRASLAAAGVQLGEGTALELQKNVIQKSEEDALSALLSGDRITSTADREAGMLGKAGDNAQTSGYLNATATVLGAAGTAAGKTGWKTSSSTTSTSATSSGYDW